MNSNHLIIDYRLRPYRTSDDLLITKKYSKVMMGIVIASVRTMAN